MRKHRTSSTVLKANACDFKAAWLQDCKTARPQDRMPDLENLENLEDIEDLEDLEDLADLADLAD